MKKFLCFILILILGFYLGTVTSNKGHAKMYNKNHVHIEQHRPLNIYHNKDLQKGPITLLNQESIKVSITKYLASDQWWHFGYELKIENNSNKVCSITIDDSYIMGIKCSPLFSITHVEPGHTAYFNMVWQTEELERNHIPYIDDIEFKLKVFFNEPYSYERIADIGNKILIKTD